MKGNIAHFAKDTLRIRHQKHTLKALEYNDVEKRFKEKWKLTKR